PRAPTALPASPSAPAKPAPGAPKRTRPRPATAPAAALKSPSARRSRVFHRSWGTGLEPAPGRSDRRPALITRIRDGATRRCRVLGGRRLLVKDVQPEWVSVG